jgi:hypothetical protein
MPEFEILDETFRGKNLEKMAFGTVRFSKELRGNLRQISTNWKRRIAHAVINRVL